MPLKPLGGITIDNNVYLSSGLCYQYNNYMSRIDKLDYLYIRYIILVRKMRAKMQYTNSS